MGYHAKQVRNWLFLAIALFFAFVWVGPSISFPPIRDASLAARARLAEVYQTVLGDRVEAIKEDISRNPLQDSVDRSEETFARAFEEATGEDYDPGERCLTMFGLIPLNCPDPTGDGFITPDRPEDFSAEECAAILGVPEDLCRR
ncbi:MAG: hypothetical protein AB4050_08550 [Synechococcus sp.]